MDTEPPLANDHKTRPVAASSAYRLVPVLARDPASTAPSATLTAAVSFAPAGSQVCQRIGGTANLALFGLHAAMWAMIGLLPLTAMFIVFSPLRRLRTLPIGPA